jgi:hypothetical protein
VNKSIAKSRTRGSHRWREKTMMIARSDKPNIPLHESLYHPWVGVLHQDEYKDCSPEQLNKEHMKKQPQDFEAYQKETLVYKWKKITW